MSSMRQLELSAFAKASEIVASLISYSDEKEICRTSGTVMESDNTSTFILTSASLIRCHRSINSVAPNIKIIVHLHNKRAYKGEIVAYDFHYNVASIKIQATFPTASLGYLYDSISVGPIQESNPLSNCNFNPGNSVIALYRSFIKPYLIMAAPGEFSIKCCNYYYECKELFWTTCCINKSGTGGPLLNCDGDVIGICFFQTNCTPFLPINIALIWWKHYKKNVYALNLCNYDFTWELCRPWLGMDVSNLYAANLEVLERIIRKFPNISEGVIVEKVIPGSSADSAGIKCNDVIIKLDRKRIKSFLELFKEIWSKVGKVVELVVIRASNALPLRLRMVVDKATSDKLYRWPLWGVSEGYWKLVDAKRICGNGNEYSESSEDTVGFC